MQFCCESVVLLHEATFWAILRPLQGPRLRGCWFSVSDIVHVSHIPSDDLLGKYTGTFASSHGCFSSLLVVTEAVDAKQSIHHHLLGEVDTKNAASEHSTHGADACGEHSTNAL